MDTDTWIIEYHSPFSETPVFLIWYTDTDENRTDKLLTFKSGAIFAAGNLADIRKTTVSVLQTLNLYDNLTAWLNLPGNTATDEPTVYDLHTAYHSASAGDFSIDVIESIAGFINLVDDYVYQDEANKPLESALNTPIIREVWEYYYNFIFWPRFNDKEKFEAWDRPGLEIDATLLIERMQLLIRQFDQHIHVSKTLAE